jgi:hypothetical protein
MAQAQHRNQDLTPRQTALMAGLGVLLALLFPAGALAAAALAHSDADAAAVSAPAVIAGHCSGLLLLEGHYRLRTFGRADFPLDPTGFRHGQTWGLEQRLRLDGYAFFGENVTLHGQADLFSGALLGPTSPVGGPHVLWPEEEHTGFYRFLARQLRLEWRAPFGKLEVGQMATEWGLGLLQNAGGERGVRFGERHLGDLVQRAAVTVLPAALFTDAAWARALHLTGAFDVVFRDPEADLLRGDVALRAAGALAYHTPFWSAGTYVVHRRQEDDEGSSLHTTAVDLFARWTHALGRELTLALALEAAVKVGRTDRLTTDAHPDGVSILGLGGVVRAEIDWPATGLHPQIELGFATGDRRPTAKSGRIRAFHFNPDYRVGLLLFHQVLHRMSARAADLVALQRGEGDSSPLARATATNGGVTNALYIYPTVDYRPLHWLSLRLGLLFAHAPAPVTAGFGLLSHHDDTNFLGGTANGGVLGYEIDAGATALLVLPGLFTLRGVIEGAVFLPGPALASPQEALSTLWTVRGGLDILW